MIRQDLIALTRYIDRVHGSDLPGQDKEIVIRSLRRAATLLMTKERSDKVVCKTA